MKPDDQPMSPREQALLTLALGKSPAERNRFLDCECANDPALRQRLEALLAQHLQPEGGQTVPIAPDGPTLKWEVSRTAPDEAVGQTIGRYRLLEKVGEGGYGVVYVAEQTEPIRRRVALKVIKLGMDTKAVVARFEAERQALAMMDHPNIAKVLDAGATETGRPYFVMELVRGIKITEYCDQNNLPTNERLELFIQVCRAIQHAHQKGIIHRDIKPSNILVTLHDGVPIPKVIDFGIAKATEGRLTDATIYTQLHQFIGTPAYMSPEQAEMSGLDVDTRSDIYSLGVLLYELLTGKTPFDAKELIASGIEGMRKTIREKEPVRPSTRLGSLKGEELTTTAKRHASEVSKLMSLMAGDLDWIVMKCLEKDRTHRYETANGVAADIARHLEHEPVIARPPSTVYRFQKAWRRNKLAFTAGAAIITALVVGLGFASAGWRQARQQRDEALNARAGEKAQREQAQANEQKAQHAEAHARAQELAARRRAYASDINLAHQAVTAKNFGYAETLLNRARPEVGQIDLRGWEWRYLWQLCRSDARETLCRRTAGIDALCLSRDGRWLMVAARYGDLSVWDFQAKVQVALLTCGSYAPRGVFSPKESLLAYDSLQDDGAMSVCLWDAVSRTEIRRIRQPARKLVGLAFSADGAQLLTWTHEPAATNTLMTVWRVADGSEVVRHTVPGNPPFDEANSLAVTPDLSLAYYGTLAGMLHAVNLTSGHEQWRVQATEETVLAVVLSPNGKQLATGAGYTDATIKLWDAESGTAQGSLDGHFSFVSHLLFLPDGKTLVSASADQTIRLWDVGERRPAGLLQGHRLEVWHLALSSDARTLVSGCKDGTVKLWALDAGARQQAAWVLPLDVNSWCFAPDGHGIFSVVHEAASGGGRVLWTAAPDFRETVAIPALGSSNWNIAISADGHWLATVQTSGAIAIFDRIAGRVVTNLVDTFPCVFASFFAGGHQLIGATPDFLTVWEVGTWRILRTIKVELPLVPLGLAWTAFSPNGHVGLHVTLEGQLVAIDLATGAKRQTRLNHREITGVAISPNLSFFATSSGEGNVKLWELATLREIDALQGYLQGVHSVAFSSDGRRLATSSDSREAVKLWDIEARQELLTLSGQGAMVHAASFSPDNTLLAGHGPLNRYLHVWRAPSWEEIAAAEASQTPKTRQQ